MKRIAAALLLCALAGVVRSQEPTADIVLVNGKVLTADPAHPTAEAIAVRGDRIIGVGSSSVVQRLTTSATRRIDLRGRTVIPGINDAHFHFSPRGAGTHLEFKSMEPDWAEVRAALTSAVKSTAPTEWIFGSVGHSIVLNEAIDRAALDALAPDHAVLLTAYYGHGYIANSRALARLGIANDAADPSGGYFERTRNRAINGRFWEYAQWRPARQLAEQADESVAIAQLQAMGREATHFGITSMQVFSTLPIDRFADLLVKARLPIRVRAIPFSLTSAKARDVSEIAYLGRAPALPPTVRISGIKWVLDGTPFEHGALLRKDYGDKPGVRGRMNFPVAEIALMLRESLDARQQLLFHAVGDGTIESVFNAMDAASVSDWPSRRLRLEHGDGLAGDLIPRARKLGVVVVQNPTHFADGALFQTRWGTDKQPLRSLLDAGVPIAIGSDGAINPFLNIMFATLHPANPREALTREQALRAYTFGAAFAEFAEADKGTIAVGKLADFAVLSQDFLTVPPPALPATHSVLTIVGGRIVHETP